MTPDMLRSVQQARYSLMAPPMLRSVQRGSVLLRHLICYGLFNRLGTLMNTHMLRYFSLYAESQQLYGVFLLN